MWRLYTYDVWNDEDGYEVIDVFETNETVDLPLTASWEELQEAFDLGPSDVAMSGQGDETIVFLEDPLSGRPEGELRWEVEVTPAMKYAFPTRTEFQWYEMSVSAPGLFRKEVERAQEAYEDSDYS